MEKKKVGAGDIVRGHCARCRDIANHTIVAMVGEKIARVQCNACGATHAHRPELPAPSEGKKKTAGAPRAAAPARKPKKDPAA
ncbi:MAG TPA: hypothetical protein VNX25_00835, partial [Verrucomicrobiae bacterium]|nr:hypothetical protein [Verrucomicrobiae bacterium]